MKHLFKILLAITFSLVLASGAKAETQTFGCSSADLSGITFLNCAGYNSGNLLSNSSSDLAAVKSIFSGLGFSNTSTTWSEKITNLNGSNTIDFATPLNGTSIIGIFKGAADTGVNGTAFYVVDAGTNLNAFKYNLSGSSSAALYLVTSPIPEPSTYMLFLVGLLAVAFVANRRKNSIGT